MTCKDCCKYPYCPYLYYFNHDKDIACIEFVKKDDYQTTIVTNKTEEIKQTPIRDYIVGKEIQ